MTHGACFRSCARVMEGAPLRILSSIFKSAAVNCAAVGATTRTGVGGGVGGGVGSGVGGSVGCGAGALSGSGLDAGTGDGCGVRGEDGSAVRREGEGLVRTGVGAAVGGAGVGGASVEGGAVTVCMGALNTARLSMVTSCSVMGSSIGDADTHTSRICAKRKAIPAARVIFLLAGSAKHFLAGAQRRQEE